MAGGWCRIWRADATLLCGAKPIVPAPTKNFQGHSPVHASTYVENAAGQVRPLVRERLPVAVLTIWSLRDAVCWPGRRSVETTRESSCWLCRGDNCRRSAHRLVGGAAAAVELGLGLTQHESRMGDSQDGPNEI